MGSRCAHPHSSCTHGPAPGAPTQGMCGWVTHTPPPEHGQQDRPKPGNEHSSSVWRHWGTATSWLSLGSKLHPPPRSSLRPAKVTFPINSLSCSSWKLKMEISLNSKLQEMWPVGSYTVNVRTGCVPGCWAQPHPHPTPHHVGVCPPGEPSTAPLTPCPPPPITWASPFRRLDRSRTRWLLLGCVLLEGEGPPPEGSPLKAGPHSRSPRKSTYG